MDLEARRAQHEESSECLILLAGNAAADLVPASDAGTWSPSRSLAVQRAVLRAQEPVVAALEASGVRIVRRLWINNAVVAADPVREVVTRAPWLETAAAIVQPLARDVEMRVAMGGSRLPGSAKSTTDWQWPLFNLQVPAAWRAGLTGAGVKVALIERIPLPHALLDPAIVSTMRDTRTGLALLSSPEHALNVAGLICARPTPQGHALGAAPDAMLACIEPNRSESSHMSACQTAMELDCAVICNAYEMHVPSPTALAWRRIADTLWAHAVLWVAAAGNTWQGYVNPLMPATLPPPAGRPLPPAGHVPGVSAVLTVGHLDAHSTPGDFRRGHVTWPEYVAAGSPGLPKPDVCAPGVGTYTLSSSGVTDGYESSFSGSSAASPLIAGVAALFVQASVGVPWSPARFQSAVEATALPPPANRAPAVHGLVQAAAALQWGRSRGWFK